MSSLVVSTSVVVCSLATAAAADDNHVVPCRPTITCTADLAPPGTFELEIGYQLQRAAGDWRHGTPFLAKLPFADRIELQLGSNGYTYSDSASYFDNIVVAAKLHLADQTARRPSLAVTASLGVPTASQRGYVQAYDAALVAHASKDIGPVHLDGNVGLEIYQLDGPRAYQPWAALAATYAATKRLAFAVEPHVFAAASPFASRDVGAIAAVEFTARDWVVFDGAVDIVGWDQRSVAALVGVSIAPVRLWETR